MASNDTTRIKVSTDNRSSNQAAAEQRREWQQSQRAEQDRWAQTKKFLDVRRSPTLKIAGRVGGAMLRGLQPGEIRPGMNLLLFLIFLVFHIIDMTTLVRQTYGGFTYGVTIWLVLMPLLANLLLESHKTPGLGAWFRDYWKYAKWGLGALLIPVLEGPLSFLLGTLGTGILNVGDIGVVTATIAVYFPLGLMPFVFGEHSRPLGDIIFFREITNVRIFVGIYIFLMFFTLLFYSSDKMEDSMQVVNEFLAEKFNYDPTVPASERATLPVFTFMKETGVKTYERTIAGLRGASSSIKQSGQAAIARSLGDAYTGKVDNKAKQKVGVYLDDVKAADNEFFTDKQVIVYTRLRAETVDDPINVHLACTALHRDGAVHASIIYPTYENNIFNIATKEDESIDCIFEPGSLASGPYVVNVSAEFDFTTLAYVKSYFIEKERLRAYNSEAIDPFAEHGITDKQPIAIYSNGPIMVGLGLNREQPVTLDRSLPSQRYTFGITLRNMWRDSGMVKEVKSITIILPEGFTLADAQPHATREITCADIPQEESCDESVSNIYQITPEEGFDKEYTYRVYMLVDREKYDDVLGSIPLITHYFKAMVEYTYQLAEVRAIKVFEPASEQIDIHGDTIRYDPPRFTEYHSTARDDGFCDVMWETDVATTGYVEYWHDANPSLIYREEDITDWSGINAGGNPFYMYIVKLEDGISPERNYMWRVVITNEHGQSTESDLKTCTTGAAS